MEMFLAPIPISQLIRFVRVCSNVGDLNNRNHLLTSNKKNFLNQLNIFLIERAIFILLVMRKTFFTSEHYLLDNILIRYGSKYSQIGGIPMGTNCAPWLQFCFRFVTRETSCCLFLPRIRLMLLKTSALLQST